MADPEYCTTQQAANMLGISVSYVQQLVEAGTLAAWKTRGGHRRIPYLAVQAYRNSLQPDSVAQARPDMPSGPEAGSEPARDIALMIIEDAPMQCELYRRQLAAWNLPLEVTFCENGYQALVQMALHKPDILLADIVMEGIDGYEVIRTIQAHPHLRDMHIAIVSGLTPAALDARGGIPPGVVYFQKPLVYDELRGYLRACCAAQARGRPSQ